jgi:hypothetical protein
MAGGPETACHPKIPLYPKRDFGLRGTRKSGLPCRQAARCDKK